MEELAETENAAASTLSTTEQDAIDEPQIDKELASLLDAEEYIQKHGERMNEYEKQMFIDMLYSDGIVVCGK